MAKVLNPYILRIEEHSDIIWSDPEKHKNTCAEFISSNKNLIVDLGCGAGNFLRDYAKLKPDSNYIGFELRYKRLVTGAIKFNKHDITNIRLIRARAEDIANWLPFKVADIIHVNFPDPWPKRKQQKNRLLNIVYLRRIFELLKTDGCFVFKTDHSEYFKQVKGLIESEKQFKIQEFSDDLHNSPYQEDNIETEFEQLFKNQKLPIYYLKTCQK